MSWPSEKRVNQLSYGREVLYRSSWFDNKSAWELKRDDLPKSCLLLIDCQNKYKTGSDLPKCTENIAKTARFFASQKIPIYWTKYNRYNDDPTSSLYNFYGGGEEREHYKGRIMKDEEFEIVSSLSPELFSLTSESVFPTKQLTSFGNPNLAKLLDTHESIFICGGWTDHCVMATAFDAFNRQKNVCIVEDGVFSLPSPKYANQAQAISQLKRSIAKVAKSDDIIKMMI